MAVEIASIERPRKPPRQLPRTSRNSVVIAALPLQWPRMAVEIATAVSADFRGLPWLVRRILSRIEPQIRAVATTVVFAAEVPFSVAFAAKTRGVSR